MATTHSHPGFPPGAGFSGNNTPSAPRTPPYTPRNRTSKRVHARIDSPARSIHPHETTSPTRNDAKRRRATNSVNVQELAEGDAGYTTDLDIVYPDELEEVSSGSEDKSDDENESDSEFDDEPEFHTARASAASSNASTEPNPSSEDDASDNEPSQLNTAHPINANASNAPSPAQITNRFSLLACDPDPASASDSDSDSDILDPTPTHEPSPANAYPNHTNASPTHETHPSSSSAPSTPSDTDQAAFEHQRRARVLRKRTSSRLFKRTHSQSVSGETPSFPSHGHGQDYGYGKTQAERGAAGEVADWEAWGDQDLCGSARRLRRRVRGPEGVGEAGSPGFGAGRGVDGTGGLEVGVGISEDEEREGEASEGGMDVDG